MGCKYLETCNYKLTLKDFADTCAVITGEDGCEAKFTHMKTPRDWGHYFRITCKSLAYHGLESKAKREEGPNCCCSPHYPTSYEMVERIPNKLWECPACGSRILGTKLTEEEKQNLPPPLRERRASLNIQDLSAIDEVRGSTGSANE